MEHFYQTIQGWFDYSELYSKMVNRFPSGSHFVEIGVWKGMSVAYMGVEIINSGKNIKFDCVDTFKGSVEHANDEEIVNNTLYQTFLKNIDPIKNHINVIVGDSNEVVKEFDDESIDFLFIDSDHTYDGVMKVLTLWYPKVKYGGIISGHDYNDSEDVRAAVKDFFVNKRFDVFESSWIYEK